MKRNMVSLRCTSLLILALFLLLHAQRSSLAHASQAEGADSSGLQQIHAYTQKEFVDGIGVKVTKKERFGGRKMIVDHELKGESAHPQMKNSIEATPMFSEKNENALEKPLKRLQVTPHNQVNVEELGTKTSNRLKAGKQATPVPNNADVKNEVERILKATKDMVNLMHGDYDRFGMPKPKPPINNNGPKD